MLLFIIFTTSAIYFAVGYHQGLRILIEESQASKIDIFGRYYSSHLGLYSDFNFMSDVFSGEKIDEEQNIKIKIVLVQLRRKLRWQILFGLLAFFSVVVQGALN
ncbi:hypothetical protein HNW13_014160 [Shewanella sp. BF02_Schw]|uniref:hypothetical protein n=1 Tax=unclassified Shewanella TaxID=196818 RepID=UPI00178705F2|nr:hypothetical protein [Shewanella sp. BF02_Schw]MBO1896903.1 hypothetical protein [Shewanella sp. BF02_Schw]